MDLSVEHLKLPPGDDLDILLLGISGHGKSATGNSILGYTKFISLGGLGSITKEYCTGRSNIDGRCIRVVDTPGFDDTEEHSDEKKDDLVHNAIANSLIKCTLGYHAIALVFSYNQRFRQAERKCIDRWLHLIGKENFQSHGILVMTCGDLFADEYPNKTIHQWWEDQPDTFKWLYENCEKRCVLFHNKTTDCVVSRKQLHDLILVIDDLKTQDKKCIPSVCQISEADKVRIEAEKRLISEIQQFLDQFDVLKNDLQILALYNHKHESILIKIKTNMDELQNELMSDGHNKIYEGIKKDFSRFEEKMSELQKLKDFPGNMTMATKNLCEMIKTIESLLNKMIENTLYWTRVKENTVVFFRDVVPSIVGPAAATVGIALTAVGVTAVAGPAAAVAGVSVGIFALVNNMYRYVFKKKENGESKGETPSEK